MAAPPAAGPRPVPPAAPSSPPPAAGGPPQEDDEGNRQLDPSRRTLRSHSPCADWPLSREEKVERVLQLYDRETRAVGSLLLVGEEHPEDLRSAVHHPSQQSVTADVPPPHPSDSQQHEVAALREEVASLREVVRQLLLPHKVSARGTGPAATCSDDVGDGSSPERTAPHSNDQADSTLHRAVSEASSILGSLFGMPDEREARTRAKSEGALCKEKPLCVERRRRRSRPEAPRRVSFADEVATLRTPLPPMQLCDELVESLPCKGRGGVRRGRELRRRGFVTASKQQYFVSTLPRISHSEDTDADLMECAAIRPHDESSHVLYRAVSGASAILESLFDAPDGPGVHLGPM